MIFAQMKRALSGVDESPDARYSALNDQFHAYLLEIAGSPQATTLVDALHSPLVKIQFRPVLDPARTASSLAEHRDLLRAIEARDADGAERAARAHVQNIRAALAQQ